MQPFQHIQPRQSHVPVPRRLLVSGTTASFYGARQSDRRMANGKRFKPLGMTAASRTLPLGATVRVTNLANHRNALVLVTDRVGRRGHALDLSLGAAQHLGMQKQGLARARIERVS
ncbi:septal ring lytic transglycosylase RlpA family lipoprotein (plasmid) [Lichenicola cladoniae]|uniref:Septal ring lytic transglycosylase RlpA family lipoprotein n=1 Tax=Lichenicola cladoniae TaxID=1484109 RepID=A0A6M8HZF5_9PROT|nr:septal ring lytic transglycosylase RlpA family lipoprotein [Acetobacteraceae bacterium]QKE93740.1 septal ring lytic transglycosylase RlpA family lipoprotein [Lichenicola cladoniae]